LRYEDEKMKKNLSINWLIFAGIIATVIYLIPFAYGAYLAITDEQANLSIGWSQTEQQYENIVVPAGIPTLRLCGHLDSPRWSYITIVVLSDSEEELYVGSDKSTEKIDQGDFCRDMEFHSSTPGKYKVVLISKHEVIATLRFETKFWSNQ
jgi:hypothetical protein